MDVNESLAISVSALDAQRRRMNVIASNLANAQSTRTAEGGPYRRRDVVFQSARVAPRFQNLFRKAAMGGSMKPEEEGVRVQRVVEDRRPGQKIYDPRHPYADPNGFVTMPNVNVMEEMVNMITASRSYEANVQSINAARNMWNRALEIGK